MCVRQCGAKRARGLAAASRRPDSTRGWHELWPADYLVVVDATPRDSGGMSPSLVWPSDDATMDAGAVAAGGGAGGGLLFIVMGCQAWLTMGQRMRDSGPSA